MLKTIDYARLADDVYHVNSHRKKNNFIQDLSADALNNFQPNKYISFYRLTDLDKFHITTGEFYAACYVKFLNGRAHEAVIAIRGTKTWMNKIADILGFWSDVLIEGSADIYVPYCSQAISFYQKTRNYLSQYFPGIRLTFTGHSLGGALAQYLVAVYAVPYSCYAFNSPGIGHMPGVKPNLTGWITNINSRYGFINKIGKLIGKVEYVDVAQEEEMAIIAWDEIFKARQLEDELHNSKNFDPIKASESINQLAITEVLARNHVMQALVPQHSIKNMVSAVGHRHETV